MANLGNSEMQTPTAITEIPQGNDTYNTVGVYRERIIPLLRYLRRNPLLIGGIGLLVGLFACVILGYLFYEQEDLLGEPQGVDGLTRALSVPAREKPSWNPFDVYPLGTDEQGRDILAVMIVGTPLTLRVGLIAAAIGVGAGMILAFMAAYIGGWVDGVIRVIVDSLIPIPGLLILVLVATSLNPGKGLSVDQMAFVISILAWPGPARAIRSQVLVMRERGYVEMARMSGTSTIGIVFKEMMPNLLPYVLASFVASVAGAILASVGLEALGLGPLDSPTLGMTIYWNIYTSSLLKGLWWWLIPPIVVIIILFVGLFLMSAGLDEVANPRLRRRV